MAVPFEQISPFIEFVEYEIVNPKDTGKKVFRCKGDPTAVIKWCRKNFGNRGDGWDFSGSGKTLDITIWSSRLITMYTLWQE